MANNLGRIREVYLFNIKIIALKGIITMHESIQKDTFATKLILVHQLCHHQLAESWLSCMLDRNYY